MDNLYTYTISCIKINTLLFLMTILLLFVVKRSDAQTQHCGSEEHLKQQMQADPMLKKRMLSIEADIKRCLENKSTSNGFRGVITIPVVVHIVYNTAEQNLSDAQIQSQIDVLNEDYSRTNADKGNTPSAFLPLAGNPNIQFVLAKRDPSGNATNGITRTSTTVTSFTQNNYVKFDSYGGINGWPRDQYLNIWVCNLSYAGYATYPGGTASIDGVVIKYQCFGRTGTLLSASKKGRTTTHEVGHWLNLEHVWGLSACGDDVVGDTPTQERSNSGFPVFPHVSSCSPNSNGDMFMNYMDYSDDAVRNMFTIGQCNRMNAVLNGSRSSLLTSLGGVAPGGTVACNIPGGLNASAISTTGATLSWSSSGAANYTIRYKASSSATWLTAMGSGTSLIINSLASSTSYEFQVASVCSNSSSSAFSSSKSFSTSTPVPVCNIPSGLNTSSITTSGATLMWTSSNAANYTIQYKPSSSTTWLTATSSGTSLIVNGLTSSTNYEFQVASVCSSTSSSAFSTSGLFTTAQACNVPSGLTISFIKTTEATISWASIGAATYSIRYKPSSSATWSTATTSGTLMTLTGLASSTNYEFQVSSVCTDTASLFSSSAIFTTGTIASGNILLSIGNSNNTTTEAPYGTDFLKEHTQFIITKSELMACGYNINNNILKSLSFNVNASSTEVMNGLTIKIMHVSIPAFADNNFLSTASATKVYGANYTTSVGWNTHTLLKPFTYNGVDNILVDIVWINTTASKSSVVSSTPTINNQTLYYRAQTIHEYISNITSGTLSLNRANMRFEFGNSISKLVSLETAIVEHTGVDQEMELYPNPTSGQLNIAYTSALAGEVVNVSIYNLTGMLVKSIKNTSQKVGKQIISVDMNSNSNLTEGIYICILEVDGTRLQKKFVLSRN